MAELGPTAAESSTSASRSQGRSILLCRVDEVILLLYIRAVGHARYYVKKEDDGRARGAWWFGS
jgi:hypothetical protein